MARNGAVPLEGNCDREIRGNEGRRLDKEDQMEDAERHTADILYCIHSRENRFVVLRVTFDSMSNDLMQQLERRSNLQRHYERIQEVKPSINFTDASHMRTIDRAKQQTLRRNKEKQIEIENLKLVEQMIRISEKKSEYKIASPPLQKKSVFQSRKVAKEQQIAKENYNMAMRIMSQKPSVDVAKMEKEFEHHQKLIKNRMKPILVNDLDPPVPLAKIRSGLLPSIHHGKELEKAEENKRI